MIAHLRGTVTAAALDHVVLDVGGVGLAVRTPPHVAAREGETVTLHTHLAVTDDALTLYGFAAPADRDLFLALIAVSGVGPKLALAALGALGADRLRAAVRAEDVGALTAVPGIGRKGAQRIVLELREQLGAVDEPAPHGGTAAVPDPRAEVHQALVGLGYAAAEAQRALDALTEPEPDGEAAPGADGAAGEDPEALLRAALRHLART